MLQFRQIYLGIRYKKPEARLRFKELDLAGKPLKDRTIVRVIPEVLVKRVFKTQEAREKAYREWGLSLKDEILRVARELEDKPELYHQFLNSKRYDFGSGTLQLTDPLYMSKAQAAKAKGDKLSSVCLQMAQAMRAQNLAETTIAGYEHKISRHVLPYFGDVSIKTIDQQLVTNFCAHIVTNQKKRSADYLLAVCRKLFKVAKRNGLIQVVPEIEGLRGSAPKVAIITHEQFKLSLEACQTVPKGKDTVSPEKRKKEQARIGKEFRLMVLLGAHAGMRSGEIAALHKRQLNLTEGKILIDQSMTAKGQIKAPKSGKGRTVYMTDELKAALEEHLANVPFNTLKVFPEVNSPITIGQRFKKILKEVNKTAPLDSKVKIGGHTFRHYCATHMIEQGISIFDISNHLGHASVETTAIYLHDYEQGQSSKRAVKAFEKPIEVKPEPTVQESNVVFVNFGGKK